MQARLNLYNSFNDNKIYIAHWYRGKLCYSAFKQNRSMEKLCIIKMLLLLKRKEEDIILTILAKKKKISLTIYYKSNHSAALQYRLTYRLRCQLNLEFRK